MSNNGLSFLDIYNYLSKINDKLESCYSKLNYINPRDNDTRLVSVTSLQSTFCGVGMISYSLYSLAKGNNDSQLMLLIGNNREPLVKSLNIMADFLRIGLLVVAMFRIESFLYSLNFHEQKGLNKYSKLEKIIKYNFSNNYDQDVFLVLTYIRNSLHCNGIHTDKEITFHIKNRQYKFEYNKKVFFAGWDDILFLLDLATELLIDLINSSKINKHQHISDISIV